jgi:cell wall assembly regulator SMI1
MWSKQIEKYKNKIPYIQIKVPSNRKEIAFAEEELGIAFPSELKELLLELNGDSFLLY